MKRRSTKCSLEISLSGIAVGLLEDLGSEQTAFQFGTSHTPGQCPAA